MKHILKFVNWNWLLGQSCHRPLRICPYPDAYPAQHRRVVTFAFLTVCGLHLWLNSSPSVWCQCRVCSLWMHQIAWSRGWCWITLRLAHHLFDIVRHWKVSDGWVCRDSGSDSVVELADDSNELNTGEKFSWSTRVCLDWACRIPCWVLKCQSATQNIPLETSGQRRSCLWFLDKHRRSGVLVQVCQQAADHAGRLTSRAMILVTMDRKWFLCGCRRTGDYLYVCR